MILKIKSIIKLSAISLLLISNCNKSNSDTNSKFSLFGLNFLSSGKGSTNNPQPENTPVTLTTPSSTNSVGNSVSLKVPAESGGTLKLGNELTFTIPAGSLYEDTTITIEKINSLPSNGDGFQAIGQSYKFSPPGTQFALDKPAILEVPMDSIGLTDKKLESKSQRLFYWNEEQNQYNSVFTHVDLAAKKLVAEVEHFTAYTVMAVPTIPVSVNARPTISNANTVPAQIHADAPILFRADVSDANGTILAVKLRYKKSTDPSFTEVAMVPENRTQTGINTRYIYTAPSTFYTNTDRMAGATIQYQFEAWDNLAQSTSLNSIPAVGVSRYCLPNTLRTNLAAVHNITVGFQTNITLSCRDGISNTYLAGQNFMYEASSLQSVLVRNQNPPFTNSNKSIGSLSTPSSTGTTFTALQTDSSVIPATVTMGFNSVSVPNSVTQSFSIKSGSIVIYELVEFSTLTNSFVGPILDQVDVRNGLTYISNTTSIKPGQVIHFGVRGYDQYMNQIVTNGTDNAINATWSVPNNNKLGYINWNGTNTWVQLYTLDAQEGYFGFLQASIAGGLFTINHSVDILPRNWNLTYSNSPGFGRINFVKQIVDGTDTHSIYSVVYISDPVSNFQDERLYYVKNQQAPVLLGNASGSYTEMNSYVQCRICATDIAVVNGTAYIASAFYNNSVDRYQIYFFSAPSSSSPAGLLSYNLNVGVNSSTYSLAMKENGGDIYLAMTQKDTANSLVFKNTYVRKLTVSPTTILTNAIVGTNLDVSGTPEPILSPVKPVIDFIGSTPYVGFLENDGTNTNYYVKRWTGTNWVQVGPSIYTQTPTEILSKIDLRTNNGSVYAGISILNGTLTSANIYVKKFNGTNWADIVTGPVNPGSLFVHDFNLEFDAINTLYVYWNDFDILASTSNYKLAHFNPLISGGSWQLDKSFSETVPGAAFYGTVLTLSNLVFKPGFLPEVFYFDQTNHVTVKKRTLQ